MARSGPWRAPAPAPLTTALMVASRNDPDIAGLAQDASDEESALVFAKALARNAVLDWEGVATVGAAGVEVVQKAVVDAQSVLHPLIPYLDTLRWVFIAAALIGIWVTIYARWDDWAKGRR